MRALGGGAASAAARLPGSPGQSNSTSGVAVTSTVGATSGPSGGLVGVAVGSAGGVGVAVTSGGCVADGVGVAPGPCR